MRKIFTQSAWKGSSLTTTQCIKRQVSSHLNMIGCHLSHWVYNTLHQPQANIQELVCFLKKWLIHLGQNLKETKAIATYGKILAGVDVLFFSFLIFAWQSTKRKTRPPYGCLLKMYVREGTWAEYQGGGSRTSEHSMCGGSKNVPLSVAVSLLQTGRVINESQTRLWPRICVMSSAQGVKNQI